MIEVIGDVALEHPPAPAAELPSIAPIPATPESKGKKSFGLLSYLSSSDSLQLSSTCSDIYILSLVRCAPTHAPMKVTRR